MRELMRFFFQILQNKAKIEEKPANNEVIKSESNLNPRRFMIGTFFMLVTISYWSPSNYRITLCHSPKKYTFWTFSIGGEWQRQTKNIIKKLLWKFY